jgi:CheY-like chemotaxis protein
LVFKVEDTGMGIAPEELDALFVPFSQTQSGQQTDGGTGLGLPISRQFVQLMGGEIGVQSQVGQGSVFSFEIPLELADPSELAPERPTRRVVSLALDQRAPDGTPWRVLVADDSAENRALLRQLLEQVGYTVKTAADGREAVEMSRAWEPHLIWMDLRMPVLDGYQATRQIKAGDRAGTVIIAVTASAFEEERARVLEAGCDDFVRKPFTEAKVFDKMAEHLGVRYVYEELAPPGDGTGATSPAIHLAPADLEALPADWVADLRRTAMAGRTEQLLDLIAQIEPEHSSLAAALRVLAEDYRFRRIVALTETGDTR